MQSVAPSIASYRLWGSVHSSPNARCSPRHLAALRGPSAGFLPRKISVQAPTEAPWYISVPKSTQNLSSCSPRGLTICPCYLHVQAQPVMHNLSRLMVQAGQFRSSQDVPNFAEAEPFLFLTLKHPSHPAIPLVPTLCLHFICTLPSPPKTSGPVTGTSTQWRYSAA
jgi:hypothetical protein